MSPLVVSSSAEGPHGGPKPMHELFKLSTRVPVEPGKSPFRVKGTYYTRTLANVELVPGGLPAVLAAIEDPRVKDFVQQKFSWNDDYDVLPIMPISVAIAKVRGGDYEALFRERGRIGSREEIPRFFRMLLSFSSPRTLAERLPLIATRLFEFGSVEEVRTTETTGTGRHRGVPLFVAPYIANTVCGMLQGALEVAAKRRVVSARYTTVVPDGEVAGLPTVAIRYEATF